MGLIERWRVAREVRATMLLVHAELETNRADFMQVWDYQQWEMRACKFLTDNRRDLKRIPSDTLPLSIRFTGGSISSIRIKNRPMIKVTDIHKRFGDLEVLKGVSLDVARGEVVSIVGASGAGKTTLLQIVGTLSRPDGGRVEIDGRMFFAGR